MIRILKISQKTLRDHLSVLFGTGMARGVAFLNNIIIARVLGISEYGKFSIFYITMILVWMIPQAFDVTFIRYAKNNDTEYSRDDFFKAIFQLKVVYMLISLILSYPAAFLLSEYVMLNKDISGLIVYGIIAGTFMCFVNTISTIFQEREQFAWYALVQGTYTILVLVALIVSLLFFKKLSLELVLAIYLATSSMVGFICLALSFRMIASPFNVDGVLIGRIITFGKWILGTSIIFFIFPRIDTFVLARYVDFSEIGIYSVATQLTMIVTVVTGSMSVVYMPKSMNSVRSRQSCIDYIKECAVPVLFIILVILGLIVLANPLVRYLYGHDYFLAVTPLRILLIGYLFMSVYLPVSYIFYAIDEPQIRFYLELSKLVTAFAALLLLVPRFDNSGAAISISLAIFLSSAISMVTVYHKLVLKFRIIQNSKILGS